MQWRTYVPKCHNVGYLRADALQVVHWCDSKASASFHHMLNCPLCCIPQRHTLHQQAASRRRCTCKVRLRRGNTPATSTPCLRLSKGLVTGSAILPEGHSTNPSEHRRHVHLSLAKIQNTNVVQHCILLATTRGSLLFVRIVPMYWTEILQ